MFKRMLLQTENRNRNTHKTETEKEREGEITTIIAAKSRVHTYRTAYVHIGELS